MKKRVLCAALASMMALSMTACSSGSTATTAAETKASEAETTTEAASSEAAESSAEETKAEAAAEGEIPAPEGDDNKISIGVTPVPHAEIVNDVVVPKLEAAGWDVEVVEFNDYVQPNTSLEDGEIDANYFPDYPLSGRAEQGKRTSFSRSCRHPLRANGYLFQELQEPGRAS